MREEGHVAHAVSVGFQRGTVISAGAMLGSMRRAGLIGAPRRCTAVQTLCPCLGMSHTSHFVPRTAFCSRAGAY